MKRILIKNARLVLENEVLEDAAVMVKNGVISGYGRNGDIPTPPYAETVDAENNLLGPGFIDIHTHLCTGNIFLDDPQSVLNDLAKHGVTGMLPTIPYGLSTDETEKLIVNLLNLGDPLFRKMFLGIHMEGPYLNPKYGAESWRMRKPERAEYLKYMELAGDMIKIWVVAPEIEGTAELVKEIAKRGIVLSIGHSEAEASRVLDLIPRGLRLACHTMCATGVSPKPSRYGGTREAGVDEVVMLRDEIYAEVIADSAGAHIRPLMLQLLYKVKGADRIILITDVGSILAVSSQKTDTDILFTAKGELAGTALTMNRTVGNMIKHAGISYSDAFKMASLNPARLLGLDKEIGSIAAGKKANLVIVDDAINVQRIMIEGTSYPAGR